MTNRRPPARKRGPRPPLDGEALERMALSYVGRFATSRMKLERHLARKLAERGWAGEGVADPAAVADRMAALGYVDDRELAGARGRSLARRGYGVRRLRVALDALGIAHDVAADAIVEAEAGGWESALRFAERRRIGPFAAAPADEAARRRAMAALIRAGHRPDQARVIVASPPGIVPQWDE